MTRIILYSDFKPGVSDLVDDCLLDQLKGTACRIGYIPSDSDIKRRYFAKVEDRYRKLGISDLMYFDLGEEYEPTSIPQLLTCDAVHLSGGDPVQFLHLVKKRGFGVHLKKYLSDGGLVVAVSAGAMILSKSLGLMTLEDGQKRLVKQQALRLFDFEFYPHFKQDLKTANGLRQYAASQKTVVYACDDDSGLHFVDGQVRMLGQVEQFGNHS